MRITLPRNQDLLNLLWDVVLTAVCTALAVVFSVGFFPGRAEFDISYQAQQMLGQTPITDWHPPVMVVVWRWLYSLTGELGSLLVLQIVLYFSGALTLSIYAHRALKSKVASLAIVASLLLPWAISQLNITWKDTQMATSLLLAFGFLALVTPRKKHTYLFLLPAFVLAVYAILVRKNAVVAVFPMCVYVGWRLVPGLQWRIERISRRWKRIRVSRRMLFPVVTVLVTVIIGLASFSTKAIITATYDVRPTGQIYQIILDDVMFSVPRQELMRSDAPTALVDRINTSRLKCLEEGEKWDAYWNCFGRGIGGQGYAPLPFQDDLLDLWMQHVISHPIRYLNYRWEVYWEFLTTSQLEYYKNKPIQKAYAIGYKPGSEDFEEIVRPYVVNLGVQGFRAAFTPAFWLISSLIVSVSALWSGRSRMLVLTLASSSALYLLAYFPVIPSNHFRYTYWPALATTVAFVLVLFNMIRVLLRKPRLSF